MKVVELKYADSAARVSRGFWNTTRHDAHFTKVSGTDRTTRSKTVAHPVPAHTGQAESVSKSQIEPTPGNPCTFAPVVTMAIPDVSRGVRLNSPSVVLT